MPLPSTVHQLFLRKFITSYCNRQLVTEGPTFLTYTRYSISQRPRRLNTHDTQLSYRALPVTYGDLTVTMTSLRICTLYLYEAREHTTHTADEPTLLRRRGPLVIYIHVVPPSLTLARVLVIQ